MSAEIIERKQVRSWHGLQFEIIIWRNWKARIGFFTHPQIANFMMRRSLPERERGEMEILHEFGHVQMFPLVLVYYLPFLIQGLTNWNEFLIVTAGMLLFWEVLAETYVIAKFEGYLKIYRNNLQVITIIYWILLFTLVILPFVLI